MINIPDKICVFFDNASCHVNTTLGTEYIEDSTIMAFGSSKKEQKTKNKKTTEYDKLRIVENAISPGFFIKKSTKNGYNGYYSSNWVVCDPRGFETSISTDNIEYILRNSTVSNGMINEVCVWTRNDNDTRLFLTPLSDKLFYKEILDNTNLMNNKIDPKSIEIGDQIMLQSGLVGTYMGKATLYGKYRRAIKSSEEKSLITPIIYRNKQILKVNNSDYYFATNLDPLKIIDKRSTPKTVDETLLSMNQQLQEDYTKIMFHDGPIFNSTLPKNTLFCRSINFITKSCPSKIKMHLEEINLDEAEELFEGIKNNSTLTLLVIENSSGSKFILYEQLRRISYSLFYLPKRNVFRTCEVVINSPVFYDIPLKNKLNFDELGSAYTISDFVKYYKVIKTLANQSFT